MYLFSHVLIKRFFICHVTLNNSFVYEILSIMISELEVLIIELEAKEKARRVKLEARILKLQQDQAEKEARILKLEQNQAEKEARILKLEQDQAERETKKNRKFQTRCIQIAKEILNEEPMIEYRPPFLNGLELDALLPKISNRIGGARGSASVSQHQLV